MRSLRPKLGVKRVSYPLAKGQIWKTDREYLHILQLGKRLIEYRILKHVDQKTMKTQMSAIRDVAKGAIRRVLSRTKSRHRDERVIRAINYEVDGILSFSRSVLTQR